MAFHDLKIKLTDTGNREKLNNPQFSISYWIKPGQPRETASYDMLSVLKGNNDVLMEVNSSLTFKLNNREKNSPDNILRDIRDLNLQYSYRKIHYPQRQNAFSFLMGGKKEEQEGAEILVYIPNEIWINQNFYKILPDYGVRYYIMKNSEDAQKVLDNMTKMTDNEKLEYFKLIIFHVASINQMGITSNFLNIENIKELLKIDN